MKDLFPQEVLILPSELEVPTLARFQGMIPDPDGVKISEVEILETFFFRGCEVSIDLNSDQKEIGTQLST